MKSTLLNYLDLKTAELKLLAASAIKPKKQPARPKVQPQPNVQPQLQTQPQQPQQPQMPQNGQPVQPTQQPAAQQPMQPNQQVPGGMPGKMSNPPQPVANANANPMLPPPQQQPAQPPMHVGPYAPAPTAKTMPGQAPQRTAGVPKYPGSGLQQLNTPQPPGPTGKPLPPLPPTTNGANEPPDPNNIVKDDELDPNDPENVTDEQKNSPTGQAAIGVANHVQDPLGATHTMFQNLGQKQLEYEMEKENARRALAPIKGVLQHVSQLHQLDPQAGMNPDAAMGYQDPNDPNQQPGMQQPGMMPQGGGPSLRNGMKPQPQGMPMPGSPMGGKPPMPGAPSPAGGGSPSGAPKAGGGAKPPGAGGGSGSDKAGKKGGKKISMTVEGAAHRFDPMAIRRNSNQTLASVVASADLSIKK